MRPGHGPPRAIVGFHEDEVGHWVADLACGHTLHMYHEPPFFARPWVLTPEGRAARLGQTLPCKECGEEGKNRGG